MTLSALFRQCVSPVNPNDWSDIVGCCTKKGPRNARTTVYIHTGSTSNHTQPQIVLRCDPFFDRVWGGDSVRLAPTLIAEGERIDRRCRLIWSHVWRAGTFVYIFCIRTNRPWMNKNQQPEKQKRRGDRGSRGSETCLLTGRLRGRDAWRNDAPKDECRVHLEGPEKEWWAGTELGLLRTYHFPDHVTASGGSVGTGCMESGFV